MCILFYKELIPMNCDNSYFVIITVTNKEKTNPDVNSHSKEPLVADPCPMRIR